MSQQTLLASLVAVADDGAVPFADGSYVDFSCDRPDGSRCFEVGDAESNAVQIEMTRADLLRLHAALTRTLLAS